MSELQLLRKIPDLFQNPYSMAPSMVVFGFHLQNTVDQLILSLIGFVVSFEEKSPVFPELEVLYFFVESLLAKFHFVLETDNPCQETHFFHVPTVVIGLAVGDEPL